MVGTSNKIEVPVVRPRIDPDPDREVKVPWWTFRIAQLMAGSMPPPWSMENKRAIHRAKARRALIHRCFFPMGRRDCCGVNMC